MEDERLSLTISSTVKSSREDNIAIPLDIVHVIFGHIASSFNGDVYDPVVIGGSREELYSPGEVALKRCFTLLRLLYWTLEPLLEWLYAHPLLPPLVHHLRLVTDDEQPHFGVETEQGPLAGCSTASKLRRVLTCFLQLRVLEMVNVLFQPEPLYKLVGTNQVSEGIVKSDDPLSPLALEQFAFYDTGRFCLNTKSMSASLSWLGNVGSILIAITSNEHNDDSAKNYIKELMQLPGRNLLDVANTISIVLTNREIPLNPSQCLLSSTFKTCLPKKVYVQAAFFRDLNVRGFLRPIAQGIDELCLDLSRFFDPRRAVDIRMEAPLGDFTSLSALTLKASLPPTLIPFIACEHAVHNVLRRFLPLASLRSLAMVVVNDNDNPMIWQSDWLPMGSWAEVSFDRLADWLVKALCDPITSQGLLSLDRIDLYCEDRQGSRIPFSSEHQGFFVDMFARVDAAELLRF